tara:strand:+ start:63988 stop:65787 length:1800 start_codon:yes stop_codon:yes gene_type:complete
LAIYLILLVCGCSGSHQEGHHTKRNWFERKLGLSYNPQTASDVFQDKCIHCHSYLNQSMPELISQGYVKPGDPEKSLIYRYLKGADVNGPESMPPKENISQAELTIIKSWIKNAAVEKEESKLITDVIAIDKLSEEEVLKRCYLKMTNRPIPSDHPRLISVQESVMSGASACLSLINSAMSLQSKNKIMANGKEGREVLKTFQMLHSGWFQEWNFFTAMSTWGTFEVLDPTRMGFYFTNSLFNDGYHLKDALRGTKSFEGIRVSKKKSEYLVYKFKNEPRYKRKDYKFIYGLSEKGKDYKEWFPTRVQTGELVGIKVIDSKEDILPVVVDSKDNQKEINPANEISFNQSIHTGHGGGVLGDEAYVSLNLGQDLGKKMNGGRILPRRWSNALVKEMLCRDLPVLKREDVVQYLQPKSSLPFRQKESCMQCHVTMDNMAGLLKNVEQTYSADAGGDGWIHSTHLYRHGRDLNLKQLEEAPDNDPLFYKRPLTSQFFYRDIHNKLIVKSLKNLDELGETLLELDDFYYCQSSKYLRYFTGLKIPISLISSSNLTKDEQVRKKLLIDVAEAFKSKQSQKDLLLAIFQSPQFRARNYLVKSQLK